jgi:hypothetical protein
MKLFIVRGEYARAELKLVGATLFDAGGLEAPSRRAQPPEAPGFFSL